LNNSDTTVTNATRYLPCLLAYWSPPSPEQCAVCRHKLPHNWLWKPAGVAPPTSRLQTSALEALRKLGFCCESEATVDGMHVDITLPLHSAVVEINGPHHFSANTRKELGATALKHRLLRAMGQTVVVVRFQDWARSAEGQQQRMARLVTAAGIALPAWDENGERSGQHADSPLPGAWAASWRANAAEGAVAAASCSSGGTMNTFTPFARRPVQAASDAAQPGAQVQRSGTCQAAAPASQADIVEAPSADVETITRRAAAIDMIQFQRGTLNKHDLLRRAALRRCRQQERRQGA
jgi:RAP domain